MALGGRAGGGQRQTQAGSRPPRRSQEGLAGPHTSVPAHPAVSRARRGAWDGHCPAWPSTAKGPACWGRLPMRCRSFRLLLLGDVYEPRVKRGAIRPAWLSPPSMPEEQALTGELTRGGGGDRECWWQDLPARRVCTKPCDGAGPRGGGGAVRQGHGPVVGRGARLLPQRGGVTWAGGGGAWDRDNQAQTGPAGPVGLRPGSSVRARLSTWPDAARSPWGLGTRGHAGAGWRAGGG